MPAEGIRVTLVNLPEKTAESKVVKFQSNRFNLRVDEVLIFFNAKLKPGEKIWIKRDDQPLCRDREYTRVAELPWEHFNNCIIAISPTKPDSETLLNYYAGNAVQKTFKEDLKAQEKLWEEKKRKKEERGGKAPLYVVLKNKLLEKIKKKKAKARIEAELAAKEKTEKK